MLMWHEKKYQQSGRWLACDAVYLMQKKHFLLIMVISEERDKREIKKLMYKQTCSKQLRANMHGTPHLYVLPLSLPTVSGRPWPYEMGLPPTLESQDFNSRISFSNHCLLHFSVIHCSFFYCHAAFLAHSLYLFIFFFFFFGSPLQPVALPKHIMWHDGYFGHICKNLTKKQWHSELCNKKDLFQVWNTSFLSTDWKTKCRITNVLVNFKIMVCPANVAVYVDNQSFLWEE